MTGISANDLRLCVIRPTLEYLNHWSQAAENLLLGTAAQESALGKYLKQMQGPALGIYQIEPATHKDVWANYLVSRLELSQKILGLVSHKNMYTNKNDDLMFNLAYATAIARIVYQRVPEPLPEANDITGLARYWKQHYNTPKGKGNVAEFIAHYEELVL